MRATVLLGVVLGFVSVAHAGEDQSPANSAGSGELRDITGIEEIPAVSGRLWWPYASAMAVVMLMSLFLLGWKYCRLLNGEREAAPGSWALAEFDRLDSLDLPDSGQAERYHTLYSELIREYLERKFHLRASYQTTPEFLQAMGASSLLNSFQKDLLRDFLERCDLAKFARVRFRKEECQALGQSARLLVEQTTASNGK